MELYVCAVRDRATEAFARPFYVTRPAEAVRSFGAEAKRQAAQGEYNAINQHPSDYELWQLAVFDDNAGTFTPRMERLARAEDHRDA